VDAIGAIASASPAVHCAEARHRGYVVVEVTPDGLRADYRYVSTTAEPQAELSTGASWRVVAAARCRNRPEAAGTRGLRVLTSVA
jgi:hypothetical protein